MKDTIYDFDLKRWMKDNRYLSPVIVNELITTMGLSVLRLLSSSINKECFPAWYAIIADEATDVANREQLILSIRWVSSEYEVSEDPVGLYCHPDAKSISEILYNLVTDILTRCTLPLFSCRGKAFDGASNMQGRQNDLATKIRKEIPTSLPCSTSFGPLSQLIYIYTCKMQDENSHSYKMHLTQSKKLLN